MRALKILIWAVCVVVVLGTILPLIRTDRWWIRVFDFTHLQVTVLGLMAAVAVAALWHRQDPRIATVLLILLVSAVGANCWWLSPYTPLARREVKDASADGQRVRVFAANVLQSNRRTDLLLDAIHRLDPDLILATETDERWTRELQSLRSEYPHTVLHPRTNTYGMNLYSRFRLIDPEVRFLTTEDIPSIRAGILVDGRVIRFYGVHPKPPGRPKHGELEPADSTQRDAELVLVAKEVQKLDEPVIVAGDFNDVAWSHTSRRFRRISRLLDPRVGRGFFNTFHAKTPLLRFPLDHLFHSDHFTLIHMERVETIGSDHFPIFVSLCLEPGAVQEQEAPQPKESDLEESSETIDKAGEESSSL